MYIHSAKLLHAKFHGVKVQNLIAVTYDVIGNFMGSKCKTIAVTYDVIGNEVVSDFCHCSATSPGWIGWTIGVKIFSLSIEQ